MATGYLIIAPEYLYIDPVVGSGVATVAYRGEPGRRVVLWERFGTVGRFDPITDLGRRTRASRPDFTGEFDMEVPLGQTYSVLMYDAADTVDPNDPESGPAQYPWEGESCLCLSHRTDLFEAGMPSIVRGFGGTYVTLRFTTNQNDCQCTAQIATVKPQPDRMGMPKFPGALDVGMMPATPTTPGDVTFLPLELDHLEPGTKHYVVVRAQNPLGEWDFREANFTTKKRRVTVQLQSLDVIDDGDPSAAAELQFRFVIRDGTTTIHTWPYPDPAIAGDPFVIMENGDSRALSASFTPTPHAGGDRLWVGGSGTDFDGIGEDNETSRSWDNNLDPYEEAAYLTYPSGSNGREDVTNESRTIWSRPWNGDLQYNLTWTYSVDYV